MKNFAYLKETFFSPFSLYAILSIFFISLEYSTVRSASTSIFIANYGAKVFPYVWIATVPVNFFVVYLYNKYLPKYGCVKIWKIILIVVFLVNFSSAFFINKIKILSFIQFMFKDIYIMLFYKQIWSLIHTSFNFKKAKVLYGFMFLIGGVGGIFGGIISGFCAQALGSHNLFLVAVPLYFLLFFIYKKTYDSSDFDEKAQNFDQKEKGYFSTLKNSNYLICILCLVLFMQMSVAIFEYKLNIFLEQKFVNVDLRTEYLGKLISIVHFLTIFFQIIGGVVLLHFLGLKKSHLIIPITFFINSFIFLIKPTLSVVSYIFVYIKSIDFSIFNIIKEMLYLPLKTDEKFRAKAIIDVFAYRTAKAFSSAVLIFLQFYEITFLLSYVTFLIFIGWIFLLTLLFKQKDFVLDN